LLDEVSACLEDIGASLLLVDITVSSKFEGLKLDAVSNDDAGSKSSGFIRGICVPLYSPSNFIY
jgi:hypothetical protein